VISSCDVQAEFAQDRRTLFDGDRNATNAVETGWLAGERGRDRLLVIRNPGGWDVPKKSWRRKIFRVGQGRRASSGKKAKSKTPCKDELQLTKMRSEGCSARKQQQQGEMGEMGWEEC
jgi:hypothetical protein